MNKQPLLLKDDEAIEHLKQAIARGKNWYIALLEAIGLWTSVEENYKGRQYRYLIAGEAFDWLVLAERLCGTVDGMLPDKEKEELLLYGRPPVRLSPAEFERIIGAGKYRQYLNYFYGITVEDALILAVTEEVRKERHSLGLARDPEPAGEVYRRIYGNTRTHLFKQFRKERGIDETSSTSLTELKEFTYWLFKYRLKHCDRARVASDTKKALDMLKRLRSGADSGPEKSDYGPAEAPE